MSGSPLLRARGLTVSYGPVAAVRDADVEVGAGEVVALLGANGAGKTSTLHALMGLAPATGRVWFDGAEVTRLSTEERVRRGLTLVPEGRRVFGGLTVEENLLLGGARTRDTAAVLAARDEVFDLFAVLADRRRQAAGTLSGGEQQQLAIGRALMSRPRLLLLDEPSLGLAPVIVEGIFDLLARLAREGITLLLVEQEVDRALALADRAAVLAGGRVVLEADAERLRDRELFARAYAGQVGAQEAAP